MVDVVGTVAFLCIDSICAQVEIARAVDESN
jgi:hypothetical protein